MEHQLLARLVLYSTLLLIVQQMIEASPEWNRYKKIHKKTYKNSETEKIRRQNWRRNRTVIEEHNSLASQGQVHYKMKETPLTEYGVKELRRLAMTIPPRNLLTRTPLHVFDARNIQEPIPDTVDYRNSPCMPPIKNQGLCGSCWAFSATTPLAYLQCVKNNNSIALTLSEQQLIDCSTELWGNRGCEGGWYENAWKYVRTIKAHMTNTSYPYTAKRQICKFSANSAVTIRVTSYTAIARYNETALKIAVALKGPVNVGICATTESFFNYGSGIYADPACNCPINHGVTVVGYGVSFGIDYWIVRNSWGPTWGLGGYALLKRGVNQCNIGFWPSFPNVP